MKSALKILFHLNKLFLVSCFVLQKHDDYIEVWFLTKEADFFSLYIFRFPCAMSRNNFTERNKCSLHSQIAVGLVFSAFFPSVVFSAGFPFQHIVDCRRRHRRALLSLFRLREHRSYNYKSSWWCWLSFLTFALERWQWSFTTFRQLRFRLGRESSAIQQF